jgi:hypothetical protein
MIHDNIMYYPPGAEKWIPWDTEKHGEFQDHPDYQIGTRVICEYGPGEITKLEYFDPYRPEGKPLRRFCVELDFPERSPLFPDRTEVFKHVEHLILEDSREE